MYRLPIFVIVSAISGCAFRDEPPVPGNLQTYTNYYSRNFIVAAPTAAANTVCGFAGGIAGGVAGYALLTRTNAGNADVTKLIPIGATIGGVACGSVVGLPFIPVSYLCDESPWYVKDQKLNVNWSCRVE